MMNAAPQLMVMTVIGSPWRKLVPSTTRLGKMLHLRVPAVVTAKRPRRRARSMRKNARIIMMIDRPGIR